MLSEWANARPEPWTGVRVLDLRWAAVNQLCTRVCLAALNVNQCWNGIAVTGYARTGRECDVYRCAAVTQGVQAMADMAAEIPGAATEQLRENVAHMPDISGPGTKSLMTLLFPALTMCASGSACMG